jgi:predicted outer membrane repeat protein
VKKHFTILTTALAAALGLLILGACANPFINPRQKEAAIGAGTGLVRIWTGAGAERTALPVAAFDHYVYSFSYEEEAERAIEPLEAGGDAFELEAGSWTVTVKAYAAAGDTSLAATGNESFEVSPGAETKVTVRLIPVTSGGTGTLSYALTYPGGAAVNSFTLIRLGDITEIDLESGATAASGSITGSTILDSGYYLAAASLTLDGIQTAKTEVVHIYQNLTTDLALEFNDQDFKAILVFSSADSGPGSLREAIANAPAGATIVLDLAEGDRVITLTSSLAITKNLTLYGGGASIQSGFTGSLVTVAGTVTINRIHFKGGRAAGAGNAAHGGAIRTSSGSLTLESCVFTGNSADGNGGAVYASRMLQIRGSTFYGNSAGNGGAVYGPDGYAFNLTGNIFYGNTAVTNPAVYPGGMTLHTFNLTDSADWSLDATENLIDDLPISPFTFKPLGGGEAMGVFTTSPGYAVDFYGKPVPLTAAAAGAVQTPTATGAFILDYAPIGYGSVEISDAAPDEDGLVSGSVTLTALDPDGTFSHWLVNGDKDLESSTTLTLDMVGHTTVRAVFVVYINVSGDNVPGSLRAAIEDAREGSGIALTEGGSFDLYGDLTINSSVFIEGNGSTLNLNGYHIVITGGTTEVRISRLLFKGGGVGAGSSGGAIQNGGKLVLESCIFNGNQTPNANSTSGGGAIYSTGSLTVFGSTFYANSALPSGEGGAIRVASGTAELQGNVFWENTAASYPVIRGTVASLGFNVSDKPKGTGDADSGFSGADDKVAAVLPFTTVNFKPFAGEAAAEAKIGATRHADYPTVDFYGVKTPATDAAAGAVQGPIPLSGYVLDYAAQGPGNVQLKSGEVNVDGLTSGPVILEAVDTATGLFLHWTVGGEKQPAQDPPNQLALDIQAHTVVRAVFAGIWTVSSGDNSGPGSLREALSLAQSGEIIILQGQTITLTEPLPAITKDLTINGNGATLTQNGFTPTNASQLLLFNGVEAKISKVHFTGGRVTTNGGAILVTNAGKLTLDSCIFSDNRAINSGTAQGGAIVASISSILNVYGCTFYDNSATGSSSSNGSGGAIVNSTSSSISLVGNVFWGNTASNMNVATVSGATTGSLNISDKALGGAAYITILSRPLDPDSFKPFIGTVLDSAPDPYPSEDFDGIAICYPAAAGAIQTIAKEGYWLDYDPDTVDLSSGSINDNFAFPSSIITLTAKSIAGKEFLHWIVNGIIQEEQQPTPSVLELTMDGYKVVEAKFITVVNNADSGDGSLRAALAAAESGDIIALPANATITLLSALEITQSIVIKGNSATLTQIGLTTSAINPLLYINSSDITVHISRLRFTGGRSQNSGAAIRNAGGRLTLESCIFNDNNSQRSGGAYGGAIYSTTDLTVLGCTFTGNSAGTSSSRGGAIYRASGALTLMGNIFSGNTAGVSPVVYFPGSPYAITGGYNVTDKATGYTSNASSTGWIFNPDPADVQRTDVAFNAAFNPSSGTGLPVIPSLPADFPTTYFDGTSRGSDSAPGAMPLAQ